MINSEPNLEAVASDVQRNFGRLHGVVVSQLEELEIEHAQFKLPELCDHPDILQLLCSDEELFAEFMETFEEVLKMDGELAGKVRAIARSTRASSQESEIRRGRLQARAAVFKALQGEIGQLDQDDEILNSFRSAKKKALELLAELSQSGQNKENEMKIREEIKATERVEKNKLEDQKKEKKAKDDKLKVLQQSRLVADRDFHRVCMLEAEVTSVGRVVEGDCPPRVQAESGRGRDPLAEETGLETLGGNQALWEVFNGWSEKPMLRVLTNRSKQEIENNLKRLHNQDSQAKTVQVDSGVREFLETDTRAVQDSVDLFDADDYLQELYLSGSPFYRDVERRVLFPYSDNLRRIQKDHMLPQSSAFVEGIRTNIFCYERVVSQNFHVKEFHRMSEDEEESGTRVLVMFIFRISELSQNRDLETTATFFSLNRKQFPIQGTVSFAGIKDFFVFEDQYVCASGSFQKGIFKVDAVLPFDPATVIDNVWDAQRIEQVTQGHVRIRPELEQEVAGRTENKEGWTRALRVLRSWKHSPGARIIEQARSGLTGPDSSKIQEEEQTLPVLMAVFQGPFFETEFDLGKIARKMRDEAVRQGATLVLVRGPVISADVEPYLLIKNKWSMHSLTRKFEKALEDYLEETCVKRVVFLQNGADPASFGEYPLEAATVQNSNYKRVNTTSEEMCLSGVFLSFAAFDPMALAWRFLRSNLSNCKQNIKHNMLRAICDQKTRCPLLPRDLFMDPRNRARCHGFAKPLDLLLMCSRKHSGVERVGQKLVLSAKPFVTGLGYGEYALVGVGGGGGGGESRRLRVEVMGADED